MDQRWTGEKGSLCFYEIRVYDGGFLILGHIAGEPSVTDPWHAALRGLSSLLLTDERDRFYTMKFAPAPPPDAKLTITLERIFVKSDRTWRGSLFLP